MAQELTIDQRLQKLSQKRVSALAFIKDRETAVNKAMDEIKAAKSSLDRLQGAIDVLLDMQGPLDPAAVSPIVPTEEDAPEEEQGSGDEG